MRCGASSRSSSFGPGAGKPSSAADADAQQRGRWGEQRRPCLVRCARGLGQKAPGDSVRLGGGCCGLHSAASLRFREVDPTPVNDGGDGVHTQRLREASRPRREGAEGCGTGPFLARRAAR